MAGEKILNKITFVIVVITLFLVALIFNENVLNGPQPSEYTEGEIDTSKDPVQIMLDAAETMEKKDGDFTFQIKSLAFYNASVKIMSKRYYYVDILNANWNVFGKLAPMDMVFAWGDLAEKENENCISYSSSITSTIVGGMRFGEFSYNKDCGFSRDYVISHASNNHLIPANENVHKALRKIEVGDKVVLEGYLVSAAIYEKERNLGSVTSSLTRSDTGCEIFYVTKVTLKDKIYT